ncbi:VanZ family protein [Salipaludibacillus sp. HK11]|uniref:VanZ family protein n=1 Tax=Salipaludibacillus sp. HK11 TaxID=3394320 RepID=UPI0039FBB7B9
MRVNKIISWASVVLWMSLIFYLSHQPATESSELSTGISEVIIKMVESIAPNVDFHLQDLNHIVRKNAHFIAYFVLGVLTLNALRRSGIRGGRSVVIALIVCVLFAISDEVHQLFIPGRSGEVRDVLIDSVGSSTGIGVYLLISKLISWRNSRKNVSTGSKGTVLLLPFLKSVIF